MEEDQISVKPEDKSAEDQNKDQVLGTEQQRDAQKGIFRYRRLSNLERGDSVFRCGFLMENGMQCSSPGYTQLLDKGYCLCAFHTANAMAIANSQNQIYTEVKD